MSSTGSNPTRVGPKELVLMASAIMGLTALGVDLMLPAFGDMRVDFDLAVDSNLTAAVVSAYVVGLAAGTLVVGPLADRYGRKPALEISLVVYAAGAVASALAPNLGVLVLSRAVWGFGAAGPRTVSIAIIRDLYEGDRMARIMSLMMAVFITVPIVAPAVGAGIVALVPWRWVFWTPALATIGVWAWTRRLGETLDPEHRLDLNPRHVLRAGRSVVANRWTLGHMLALVFSYGAFLSWLASSELIVDDVLGQAALFPVFYGCLAGAMGVAVLLNARVVESTGAHRLVRLSLGGLVASAVTLLAVSVVTDGKPSTWALLLPVGAIVTMHALLVPNANAMAMEPMGDIAGTAAAVIGAAATGGGAVLAALIDRAYDGTVTPMAIGFMVMTVAALTAVRWAGPGSRPAPATRPAGATEPGAATPTRNGRTTRPSG